MTKTYNAPLTPNGVRAFKEKQKSNLKLTFDSLNPIELKNTLDQKMSLFNSMLTTEQKMGAGTEIDQSANWF